MKELNFFVPHAKAELSKDSPENSVNVSWNYCANFDGYVLYRSFTRDGCTETETFGFPNDVTSFFDTTCEPGTEYTYKVSTDYHIFAGMYLHMMLFIPVTSSGDEVKITTMPDSKVCIKYPQKLLVSQVEGHTNALKLKWDPCENATYYEVYKADYLFDGHFAPFEKIKTVSEAECTIFGLINESEYYFKVKAFGENESSSVFSTFVEGTCPKATNLSMDRAYHLKNGVEESFYINMGADNNPKWYEFTPETQNSLWFMISPEKGVIKVYLDEKDYMLFAEDGSLLNSRLKFSKEDEYYIYSIKDNFSDFEAGRKYYIRVVGNSACLLVE